MRIIEELAQKHSFDVATCQAPPCARRYAIFVFEATTQTMVTARIQQNAYKLKTVFLLLY